MKIIAKKGTDFEQTLKTMCEIMTEGIVAAQDMVEKMAGGRPINIFHLFHWGIISEPVPEFDFHPDDREKIDSRVLRRKRGTNVYVPALRFKEGQELHEAFCKLAEAHTVTDEPLHKYGIHQVDMVKGISYAIKLVHVTDTDRYMLVCSDSLPKTFDKKKLAKDQFDIEY